MKRLILSLGVLALFCTTSPCRAADSYTVKVVKDSAAPKEVSEPIRKLLDTQSVQFGDAKGNTILELWFRKSVPVKATEAQIKNGLTYKEVPVSTLVGAMRVTKSMIDYRKQRVRPGVYTLRFAQQPMDGDHMGTAPYSEFCVICPAADDKKPDTLEVKKLQELSARTTENHPAVLLLFPGTDAKKEPKVANKGEGHWVLFVQVGISAGAMKGTLSLGLTLVGVSASA